MEGTNSSECAYRTFDSTKDDLGASPHGRNWDLVQELPKYNSITAQYMNKRAVLHFQRPSLANNLAHVQNKIANYEARLSSAAHN